MRGRAKVKEQEDGRLRAQENGGVAPIFILTPLPKSHSK